MKSKLHRVLQLLCLPAALALLSPAARAQTATFTYQGKLTDGLVPASGLHDFQFKLFSAAGGGAQQGTTVAVDDVSVTGGLFTVNLDFGGGVFGGSERWLEIAVRPGASTGNFTILAPRQAVTSTPYAIRAAVASAVPAGSITGSMIADGTVTAAKIAQGAVSQLGSPDGSPAAAVQVNAGGLVGVGTSNPAAGLHITASQSFLNAEQMAVRVDESDGYTRLKGARAVAVQGNLAAVAGYGDSGITLLDVTSPGNPFRRAQIRDGEGAFTQLAGTQCVAMKPNVLAVGAFVDSAVTLIDVSTPTSPVKLAELRDGIGGWNELSGVFSVAIDGNLMAIAALHDSTVTLADITNPAAPVRRVELKDGAFGFDYLGAATIVALSGAPGNLLAIASNNDAAVTLVDVTNPTNPVKRAELRDGLSGFSYLDHIQDVKFSGNLLAIASQNNSAVTLVDVTNPVSPVKLSELRDGVNSDSLSGAAGLAFSGSQLAVSAAGDDAVTVYDISNPVNPAVLAVARNLIGFSHLDQPRGLTFAGPNLLVATELSDAVTMMRLATRSAGLSSQGWVGIGTTTPAGALHVLGDVFVEQSDRIEMSTLHFAAGLRSNASGDYSSAIGLESQAIGSVSVALGYGNKAAGPYSTAIGVGTLAGGRAATAVGEATTATGDNATSMGFRTTASGNYSTAMGYFARALHDGSFVWSDRQTGSLSDSFFSSTVANQFSLRASGGVRFETGGAGLTVDGRQALLAPASGQPLILSNDTSLSFGNQTRQMINLWNADYGIGVQGDAAYFRTGNDFYWYRGGSHSDTRGDAGSGGVPLMSLTSSGSLGLGTTSPGAPLEVVAGQGIGRFTTTANTNGAVVVLKNTTAAATYLGAINFESTTTTPGQIGYLADDQMVFRIGGQPGMNLNATGLTVNGTFVSSSDRNMKENFTPADARAVLDKVAALPVSEWNYKADPDTRHIGPMAQDFQAAFRVGPDDKHIATVDADGVALAAIKGLNAKVEERTDLADTRIRKLEAENAELKARLERLEQLLIARAAN